MTDSRVAVAPDGTGRGTGQRPVADCFEQLALAGIPRCNIFVYADNEEGNRFWVRNGWDDPTTWKVLQKVLQKRVSMER